jgi:hypothetical protein
MQLPNGDQAIVDIIKLRAYCLNTAHVNKKYADQPRQVQVRAKKRPVDRRM